MTQTTRLASASLLLFTTLTACASGDDTEDDADNGYIISWANDDISNHSWTVVATRAGESGDETRDLHAAGSGAAALADDAGGLRLAFLPPNVSGTFADPGAGWMTLWLPTFPSSGDTVSLDLPDVLSLDDVYEYNYLAYYDENKVEHLLSGNLVIDEITVNANAATADPEGGWADGGDFSFSGRLENATVSLDDGGDWAVAGDFSARGSASGTPIEGGGGVGDVKFTCRSGNLCVEYSIPDADRADDLRSQCASSSDGHDCDRSGAGTCRHTSSTGDSTCTVTSDPPSDHDAICSDGGNVGC